MADLEITLPSLDLGKTDTVLVVRDSDGIIGKIKLSTGTIEWWPKGRSVNIRSMSWPEFAKICQEHGTAIKKPRSKKAAPVKTEKKASRAVVKAKTKK